MEFGVYATTKRGYPTCLRQDQTISLGGSTSLWDKGSYQKTWFLLTEKFYPKRLFLEIRPLLS